jgi:hypothetical protein
MILNLARKLLVCLNQLIQYQVMHFSLLSVLGDLRDSGNSINISANNLQFFDLTGSYFFDCNYKWYGLHNVKVLNFSESKYDLKPRKKAPCLSEPINPIPSDAFFITKRSTFLNVLKKLLSIDEHLDSEKFSTLTLCSPYHLSRVARHNIFCTI